MFMLSSTNNLYLYVYSFRRTPKHIPARASHRALHTIMSRSNRIISTFVSIDPGGSEYMRNSYPGHRVAKFCRVLLCWKQLMTVENTRLKQDALNNDIRDAATVPALCG